MSADDVAGTAPGPAAVGVGVSAGRRLPPVWTPDERRGRVPVCSGPERLDRSPEAEP
jgi:hypothetical protein